MDIRRRWCAAVAAVVVLAATACSNPASVDSPAAPTATSPASQADLAAQVERYVHDHGLRYDTIRSVRVQVDGTSRLEYYRHGADAETHLNVWSVTKSVLSMLVGAAIAEGKISGVDATLAELLPEHTAEMTETQRGITLEQLLTMTGGFADDDHLGSAYDGSVSQILALDLQAPPGERFIYSNAGAHMISAVLTHAVGESVLDYARRVLFDPLGIRTEPAYTEYEPATGSATFEAAEFAWATDPDGIQNGCCMLKLTAGDMVALGQLYLDQGRAAGTVIVPANWVMVSTQPSPANADYGYLWWRGRVGGTPSFAAVGYAGQLIAVVPDRRAVITVAAEPTDQALLEPADVTALVDEVIAPALG